jgi:hypothetical protein
VPLRRTALLKKSLLAIERAFADFERRFAALTRRVRVAERRAGRGAVALAKPRRRLRLTSKRRAQLKLQGAYMGYMRQLAPRQKGRVKAVKEKKGYEAAIKMARSMARP